MDDALLVSGLKGFRDLFCDRQCLVERDRSARDAPGQVLAGDQLHGECVNVARLLEPIDLRDVGVIQGGQRFGLALEAGDPFCVGRERLGEDLDSDVAVKACVSRLVDLLCVARTASCFRISRLRSGAVGCSSGTM
jgi:hypothetical protein